MKTYILEIKTEKQMLRAEKLQARLYNKYHQVIIKPEGLDKIRIEAINNFNIK